MGDDPRRPHSDGRKQVGKTESIHGAAARLSLRNSADTT